MAGALGVVRGTSYGGGTVVVTGIATGGAGGIGAYGSRGGDGARINLSNAVYGSTTGQLKLVQTAIGGAGGASVGNAQGGLAGDATSSLYYTTASPGPLTVTTNATGRRWWRNQLQRHRPVWR